MFYSLTGNIIFTDPSTVAIDCHGVGYKCTASINTLRQIDGIGNTATLYTYLSVREDAMELFGFADKEELECFKLLISVSGVGPKAAISILSELTPEKLALCIATGDVKSITAAQGVGPKIAQRVVLELKDKIKNTVSITENMEAVSVVNVSSSESASEAVSALVMLGYSQSEATAAVAKLDSSLSVEEIIKQALKML